MFDQSPSDPFLLDCLICAERPAIMVTTDGLFHCEQCNPEQETKLDPSVYCISCGVDSRMMGKEVCYWCYDSDGTQPPGYVNPYATTVSGIYSGLWGDDEYFPTAVEDDVELIQAVR